MIMNFPFRIVFDRTVLKVLYLVLQVATVAISVYNNTNLNISTAAVLERENFRA
jgi:hypothetical protein